MAGKLLAVLSNKGNFIVNCRPGVDPSLSTKKESLIATTSNTAYEMTKLGEGNGQEYKMMDMFPEARGGVEVTSVMELMSL